MQNLQVIGESQVGDLSELAIMFGMGTPRVWMVYSFLLLSWKHQTCSEPKNLILLESRVDCPTWHFYNQENGKCESISPLVNMML